MQIPSRDRVWLDEFISHAPDVKKYAYRSGAPYGHRTYSVGTSDSLDELREKWEGHWQRWLSSAPIATRVYERQEDGSWKFLHKFVFRRPA